MVISLGFSWGIIADSDIESERFRFLGEARFTLAGLKCTLINKVYQGTLHYIPFREYQVQSVCEPIGLESFREIEESVRKKPMMGECSCCCVYSYLCYLFTYHNNNN